MSRLRLLLVDNYDSFTWNLAQALASLGAAVDVRLNNTVDPDGVERAGYDAIVISPGPGRPEDAGVTPALVGGIVGTGRLPLLGVCLGHQALGMAFGARLVRAPTLMHGKTSRVDHVGSGIYSGMPRPFPAMRYHSLTLDPSSVASPLVVEARSDDGVVMGIRHRDRPWWGVQFHPESILTPDGSQLLGNFLVSVARQQATAACSAGAKMIIRPGVPR